MVRIGLGSEDVLVVDEMMQFAGLSCGRFERLRLGRVSIWRRYRIPVMSCFRALSTRHVVRVKSAREVEGTLAGTYELSRECGLVTNVPSVRVGVRISVTTYALIVRARLTVHRGRATTASHCCPCRRPSFILVPTKVRPGVSR